MATVAPIHALAQVSMKEEANSMIQELTKDCEESGRILAEARFNKWKKTGKLSEEVLNDNAYRSVVKVMQQQCVSVQFVLILRKAKSILTTEEAAKRDLDNDISKHMALIEKSL